MDLPETFLAHGRRGPDWQAWIDGVPRLLRDLTDEWDLTVDGTPRHGFAALVVPVLTRAGVQAALKVGWVEPETEHEALALQRWDGDGAVRLLRADPRRGALLLERLGEPLSTRDAIEACEVVAGLYGRLHRPAGPPLRPLSGFVGRWTDDLAALDHDPRLPRRYVDQAIHLGRAFAADPGTDGRMIHGDLHDENVLASDRGWLAIDPHAMSGDPHYEVAPLLWNRWDEVVASGDVRREVRLRFHTTIDAAGLDEDRARDWIVVREAFNALWAIEDGSLDELTVAIAVIKAVQE